MTDDIRSALEKHHKFFVLLEAALAVDGEITADDFAIAGHAAGLLVIIDPKNYWVNKHVAEIALGIPVK